MPTTGRSPPASLGQWRTAAIKAAVGHELTVACQDWPPGSGHRAAAGLGRVGSRSRTSCIKRRCTAPFRAVAGAAATALTGKSHRHTAFSLLQLAGSKEVTL